jgi:CRP-like cAMP-binding protein
MSRPNLTPDQLRSIPLLGGFEDDQLASILAVFSPVAISGDAPLFERGEQADAFYLLTAGSVTLDADDDESYILRPLSVIGELGALTGRTRNCAARVSSASEVWRAPVNAMVELFERDTAIGLGFQQNLMNIVAEKISRDQVRMHDMRANIVATQKAMKQMRELLLESQDTVVSQPLHDTIEGLIHRNRRANYRVEPPASMVALLRLDDGMAAQVMEISRTHVSFRNPLGAPVLPGSRISAVLMMNGPEIPISGVVLRTRDTRVDVRLDLMLEEYAASLEGYLTRVQMLDFLV